MHVHVCRNFCALPIKVPYVYTVCAILNVTILLPKADTWLYMYMYTCTSPQTMAGSVLSPDKLAIQGEELGQTLQSSVISHKDEIALLQEQMREQYSAGKYTGHIMVVIVACQHAACHFLECGLTKLPLSYSDGKCDTTTGKWKEQCFPAEKHAWREKTWTGRLQKDVPCKDSWKWDDGKDTSWYVNIGKYCFMYYWTPNNLFPWPPSKLIVDKIRLKTKKIVSANQPYTLDKSCTIKKCGSTAYVGMRQVQDGLMIARTEWCKTQNTVLLKFLHEFYFRSISRLV